MKNGQTPIYLSLIIFIASIQLNGQTLSTPHVNYINKYNKLAIKHQKKYKIPASIKLAQGLHESNAGRSRLAIEGNNHFGIKCKSDWTGKTIYSNDDTANECFRQYNSAKDSYEDHSKFLSGNTRYSKLFTLDIKDYKSWANELKAAGYATDPQYPTKLIKMIEDYELYKFDAKVKISESASNKKTKQTKQTQQTQTFQQEKTYREIFKTFGLLYVIANQYDSFESIAYDLDFKAKDLASYNELPENYSLKSGDIVFLEKKKNKADKPFYEHLVTSGESMHSIAQKYGMKLSCLYKMNTKKPDSFVLEVDMVLRLR